MNQPSPSAPSSGSTSFAGLLASLTASPQKRMGDWNDDGLADDVATLSYERALRAHSRYKMPEATDRLLTRSQKAESVRIFEAEMVEAAPEVSAATPVSTAAPSIDLAENRKRESTRITIRMSKAECAQLRQRAAEAGLTVSAYLRSCTFETESLRAMVKDTLAQLRGRAQDLPAPSVREGGLRSWFARLRPGKVESRQIAHV